mgnify:CR=1 FL=1
MSSKEGDADETTSSKIENNASEVDTTISTMTEGTFFFFNFFFDLRTTR